MKRFKLICRISVVSVMALVIILTGINTLSQNLSGNYSAVCGRITPQTRQFVYDNFGNCETVEELLLAIDDYGMKNFTYDGTLDEIIQNFQFDEFVFEKNLTGLCFDFSCFAKCTTLVWAEYKNVDVKCYVYDVKTKDSDHSYNYFIHEDKTYFLDITHDNTAYQKGKTENIWGPLDIKDYSPKQFSKEVLDDRIMIIR